MTGCQTCGGHGMRHDPIAHDAEPGCTCGYPGLTYDGPHKDCPAHGNPCVTDWLCLPGAHLRFGECVEAEAGDK